MAEAIARREVISRGLMDVEVASAGTSAWDGAPASDGALLVAMERNLDLGSHLSQQLTPELVAWADLILAMGPHHLERVEALGGEGKATLLAAYASHDGDLVGISDPFGGHLEGYRTTFDELEKYIRRAFDRLTADRPPRTA
jgi:protein-tyrosine-phosphatase